MRQWERGGECLPLPSISSSFLIAGPPSRQRPAGKAVNLQHSPEGLYALGAQLGERPEDMGVRRFESGRGPRRPLLPRGGRWETEAIPCGAVPLKTAVRTIRGCRSASGARCDNLSGRRTYAAPIRMRIWAALWMCPELRRVAHSKSGEGRPRSPPSPQ